ncbi:outer membrane protein assembly factor BamB family protein [Ilumatobacter nonamiensis]|uniref:outer membrane protein assembly factor BamB family protein n=1 Tax=Ilumatobacter nonamiensis TaxID=467093 RepID=UPI0011D1C5BA|nr:PQQ-binding-like beta-propeller repeat protein [Ilumatobacter nonamiensis]
MAHDGVAPDPEDDDSPWRADAEVSFVHPPRRSFVDRGERGEDGTRSEPASPGGPRSTTRRIGVALGGLAALVIGGAAVMWTARSDPPIGAVEVDAQVDDADDSAGSASDLGGDVTSRPDDVPGFAPIACASPRLPMSIEPLWSEELADVRSVVAPITVSPESVVTFVRHDRPAADGSLPISVVALDLDDGGERWRAEMRSPTGRHEVVGIVDRTVIVRSASGPDTGFRRLFGFDEDSGELLWDRGFRGDWTARLDATTGLVYVGVRRPAATTTTESEVEVVNAQDGDRVHIAAGAIVGIDPDGRLITRQGDNVLATSPADRDLLGVVVPSDSPFAALGTGVVVAPGNATDISVYSGTDEPRTVPLTGSPGIDPPGFVVGLEPLGEASLIVTGGGSVHGAEIVDDTVEIRWRVSGIVLESVVSDRGRSLLVATEGGAKQRVIDSSTGSTLVDLDLRPGSQETLTMASNGVVVQDIIDGDLSRVAFDLDGRELWSLPGSGPVAIGRGVVATVQKSDDVTRVSAWGDASGPSLADGCRAEPQAGADDPEPVAVGASSADR